MGLEQLQIFLNQNIIPKVRKKPKTFLGIAQQPHYETVLSNLYAFYFDVDEEHGLGDLFINSLIECIEETEIGEQKDFSSLSGFNIETEYPTNKGRIDILINGEAEAIIIENKVYHYLNNNLDDYWDSVVKGNKKRKNSVGVVLSLHKIENIRNSEFVNVTHRYFLEKVMANLGNYLMVADEKYIVFLKDLFQNILNMSKKDIDRKSFNFYYTNQQNINEIIPIEKRVRKYVCDQLDKVPKELEILNNRKISKSAGHYYKFKYYDSIKFKGLKFVIVFDKLFDTNKQLSIKLIAGKIDEFKFKEMQNMNYTESYPLLENQKMIDKNKILIGEITYNLSKEEIYDIKDYVINKIKNDGFYKIFLETEKLLIT